MFDGTAEFRIQLDGKAVKAMEEIFWEKPDKEIVKKLVDIYNYMAKNRFETMDVYFKCKMIMHISLDDSEYKRGRETDG